MHRHGGIESERDEQSLATGHFLQFVLWLDRAEADQAEQREHRKGGKQRRCGQAYGPANGRIASVIAKLAKTRLNFPVKIWRRT